MSVMVGNGKAQNLNIKFPRSKIKIEQIYLMLGTQHETGVLSRPNKKQFIEIAEHFIGNQWVYKTKRRKIALIL